MRSYALTMKKVDWLTEELPPQAKIETESGPHLPIVLEVNTKVILFERNRRISLGHRNAACAVGATSRNEVIQSVVGKCALYVGEEDVRRILVKELAAEGDGMTPDGPVGVVLNLTDFDDSAVREDVRKAKAGQSTSVGQRKRVEIGWACVECSDGAIREAAALEGNCALLEAVAKLINPAWAKGVGFVGANGVSHTGDIDVAAIGRGAIGRRRIRLVEVANVYAILGSGLPVDTAQILLVGGEERNLAAELSKRNGASAWISGCGGDA